ncbi:MAG: SDR family oxidoreductase [Aggregatilineales bacterium]
MTDISRHFNGIIKILLQPDNRVHLRDGVQYLSEGKWDQLRAYLPDSYEVPRTVYRLVKGKNSYSSMFASILDLSKKKKRATPQQHIHIDSVLMLPVIGNFQPSTFQWDIFFNQTQAVKSLKSHPKTSQLNYPELPPVSQRHDKIPKYRLPVIVWVFDKVLQRWIPDIGDKNRLPIFFSRDEYITLLMEKLDSIPIHFRPDFVYATGYDLLYRNPLLEQRPLTGYDIGLSKIEPLRKPRMCYQCGEKYLREHFFYERLCVRCGDINYRKRQQTADLSERIALVTGGRVKIGYQTALKLLRAGAQVIVTSRFPHDSARRFAAESDFDTWGERLHIYGLDLRHMPSLQAFITHVKAQYPHLDMLINNAAQTVRRPPAYYKHLIDFETQERTALPEALQSVIKMVDGNPPALSDGGSLLSPVIHANVSALSAQLSQIPLVDGDDDTESFPENQYDADGQQIDNRVKNSWTLPLDEVSIPEMLEVQLVNVIAPEMLVSQLKVLMSNSPFTDRYIVNVSAAEGRFGQGKTHTHIHTNMAKAALNMLTYSAAPYYAESGIYMTSVDPGWVSDQAPINNDAERAERQQIIPLDYEDGASRVCDPIFLGVASAEFLQGVLLKNYAVVAW